MKQSFDTHIKFVQLTLEQDVPRELSYLLPFQLDFHHQKLKTGPTLGDQILNVNDAAAKIVWTIINRESEFA